MIDPTLPNRPGPAPAMPANPAEVSPHGSSGNQPAADPRSAPTPARGAPLAREGESTETGAEPAEATPLIGAAQGEAATRAVTAQPAPSFDAALAQTPARGEDPAQTLPARQEQSGPRLVAPPTGEGPEMAMVSNQTRSKPVASSDTTPILPADVQPRTGSAAPEPRASATLPPAGMQTPAPRTPTTEGMPNIAGAKVGTEQTPRPGAAPSTSQAAHVPTTATATATSTPPAPVPSPPQTAATVTTQTQSTMAEFSARDSEGRIRAEVTARVPSGRTVAGSGTNAYVLTSSVLTDTGSPPIAPATAPQLSEFKGLAEPVTLDAAAPMAALTVPGSASSATAVPPIPPVTPQPPPVQAAQTALVQISSGLTPGNSGETIVRLDPPELGALRISLTMSENGQLLAVVSAERPDVDTMLRRHGAELTGALEAAGYDAVDLSFSAFSHDEQPDRPAAAPLTFEADETSTPAPTSTSRLADGGLDLRV